MEAAVAHEAIHDGKQAQADKRHGDLRNHHADSGNQLQGRFDRHRNQARDRPSNRGSPPQAQRVAPPGERPHGRKRQDLDSLGPRLRHRYTTSNNPAAPMPPPMHMVTTTFFTQRRLPSMSA